MKRNNIVISLTESPLRLNESDISRRIINETVTGQNDSFIDSELSIQEQVVIGALGTVAFLSIVAILLRLLMPMFRKTKHKVIHTECKYEEQIIGKEKRYGQLPYKVSSSNSSQSSWSSNSQLDWSDSSSNNTRSTYYTTESKNMSLPSSYGNFRGSSSSLPLQFTDERSSKNSSSSYLRCNDEPVYIVNKKSLEPLKLDDAYRSRWDEEFDPLQVTPSGSLSSLSHPSEDRNFPDRFSDFSDNKRFPQKGQNPSNTQFHVSSKPTQTYRL